MSKVWLMKRILLTSVFILFYTILSAKDSTIVFRTSIGISYTHLIEQKNNFTRTEYTPYFVDTTFKMGEQKGFSPIIKTGIRKAFSKNLGVDIGLSYSYGKIYYNTYHNDQSQIIYNASGIGKYDYHSHINYNTLWSHDFMLSLAPAFFYHRAYIIPSFNINYLLYDTRSEQTQTNTTFETLGSSTGPSSPSFNKTSSSIKESIIHLSEGLSMGYDLKIKKIGSFVELGGNFQNHNQGIVKNLFSVFLTLGVRF